MLSKTEEILNWLDSQVTTTTLLWEQKKKTHFWQSCEKHKFKNQQKNMCNSVEINFIWL